MESDASVICVGTPSNGNGSLHLTFVEQVCREIGAALKNKKGYHVVVVRSTMLPGTVQDKLIVLLEEFSGKRAGSQFGVALNPEFLREGSAIDDYYRPSYIVIGQLDARSGDTVQEMFSRVDAPVVRTDIRTAEMVKYVSNTFHAVKVVFANEIGTLCKSHGIDGQQVMDLFCQDRRLNISPAYLRPGFAFGGSCLPKDLRAPDTGPKNAIWIARCSAPPGTVIVSIFDMPSRWWRTLGKRKLAFWVSALRLEPMTSVKVRSYR